MNLEPEFTAKPPEGPGGFLSLATLSLLAGAVAGLIGAIFRLSLDQADRFRDALIAWAHGEKLAGFLLVAATCTAAARGRQMLHEISGDGTVFGVPRLMGERMCSIVAWSRLFVDQEVLVAFSTDPEQPITAYSTVEPRFRAPGHLLKLIFWHTPAAASRPPQELVVERRSERLAVRLTVPPAGFVMYQAASGRGDPSSSRLARTASLTGVLRG
jgi:hypothetical protein